MKGKRQIAAVLCISLLTGCSEGTSSDVPVPTVPPLVTEETSETEAASSGITEEPTAEDAFQEDEDTKPVSYTFSVVSLPEEMQLFHDAVCSNEGLLYYCISRTDAETFGNTTELMQLFPENAAESDYEAVPCMTLLKDTLASVMGFDLLPDGGVCALVCGNPFENPPEMLQTLPEESADAGLDEASYWDTYYQKMKTGWSLLLYDKDGNLTKAVDLTAFSDESSLTFSRMAADAQGNLYVTVLCGDEMQLWILDQTGSLQQKISADSFSAMTRILIASDGRVLLFGQDTQYCSTLAELDADTGTIVTLRTWTEHPPLTICTGTMETAPYYSVDETGIYFEAEDAAAPVQLMCWEETNVSGSEVCWIETLPYDRFGVIYTDETGTTIAGILENLDKNGAKSELF